jgi:hypothetical protein
MVPPELGAAVVAGSSAEPSAGGVATTGEAASRARDPNSHMDPPPVLRNRPRHASTHTASMHTPAPCKERAHRQAGSSTWAWACACAWAPGSVFMCSARGCVHVHAHEQAVARPKGHHARPRVGPCEPRVEAKVRVGWVLLTRRARYALGTATQYTRGKNSPHRSTRCRCRTCGGPEGAEGEEGCGGEGVRFSQNPTHMREYVCG